MSAFSNLVRGNFSRIYKELEELEELAGKDDDEFKDAVKELHLHVLKVRGLSFKEGRNNDRSN